MDRVNILATEPAYDDTDPDGYRAGMDRFGTRIGAQRIGGSVYDVPAGQSICPYHYELGDEEWLIVLSGRPTIRTPTGSHELEPGDTVCFPEGPDGAHKVTNEHGETARVLMIATRRLPSVAIYPDSDKVGVWEGFGEPLGLYRRDQTVGYYDGEVS
jgi:uncharacterized cupin superfamily protein